MCPRTQTKSGLEPRVDSTVPSFWCLPKNWFGGILPPQKWFVWGLFLCPLSYLGKISVIGLKSTSWHSQSLPGTSAVRLSPAQGLFPWQLEDTLNSCFAKWLQTKAKQNFQFVFAMLQTVLETVVLITEQTLQTGDPYLMSPREKKKREKFVINCQQHIVTFYKITVLEYCSQWDLPFQN